MKTKIRFGMALGLALPLAMGAACGGTAKPTTKKEMSNLAREAPPPPPVDGAAPIDRKVTSEAKTEFAQAVAFFNEQEKGGWTADKCTAAAKKFQSVAESHDKLVEAWFNAGVSYQRCNDAKNAQDMYQKALKINPAHAPSLANLGEIYFRGGNDTIGEQYFESAIKADAKITAARNNRAWIAYTKLRKTSDPKAFAELEQKALGDLSRVLAVDNDNVVAYTIMALVYMEGSERNKSRLDVAKLLLEEGKKRNDKYAPLYNAWGLLHLRRDNVGSALSEFRKAVALDPKFTEARMNVGQLVLSFRKYQEAEENFRFVLNQPGVPKDTRYDATVGLGVALRGLKKIKEAEDLYKAAMKLQPERGDAFYNMGLLWKDFRTNEQSPQANKQAYMEARKFFSDFLAKQSSDPEKKRDAQDHVEDCNKYIAQLDQVIQAMSGAPPAPPPAPKPAPKPKKK